MKRIFYRVKDEYDQKEVYHGTRLGKFVNVTLIGGELLTFSEVITWSVPLNYVEGYICSEKDWYPSFGARFLCENHHAKLTHEFDDILERRANNNERK